MSETEKNIVRTSIRMNGTLHQRLSDAVHELKKDDRSVSIERTVQEAIRRWLDDGHASGKSAPQPAPTPPRAIPAKDRWHQMLDEILADPRERGGIEKALEWAAAATQRNKLKRKPA